MRAAFITFFLLTVFVFAVQVVSSALMSSSSYQITSDVIGVSGSESTTSTTYQIRDTIGETIATAATSSSSNYGLKSGFRQVQSVQTLTFSVSTSTLAFGDLSASSVTTATHTMSIVTNAFNGFSITVSGNTLTKGTDTITAIGATEASSSAGSEQFGINLVANTSPSVGSAPSGTSPIGSAANHYNTANRFAFQSGNTVATSTGPVNSTTLTVSYIANISSSTEGGEYSTTLTYTAAGRW